MSSPPTAEYVIVGSGAGGGPLAVRLAAAGHSVLVLEAGELATDLVTDVPVFHGFARGVSGLRIVDASVFPRIPGYFIVTAVYMISEKAADVILAHAQAEAEETLVPASFSAPLQPQGGLHV